MYIPLLSSLNPLPLCVCVFMYCTYVYVYVCVNAGIESQWAVCHCTTQGSQTATTPLS